MIAILEENQLLNSNLSRRDIDRFKKSEFIFDRMLKELSVLHECIENNTLHLAEFKLSVGTRKIFKETYKKNQQILDISLLVEAANDPASVADTSKNILSLINKFHSDNNKYLDSVVSDTRLSGTAVPKNIGAEPSILQKVALKTKELGGKAGQVAMNLFQAIVINALNRLVNWTSSLKTDILDAKKQGSAWQMIMTKLGPSMKIAKRASDGTITYENDSSGTGMLNKLQDFVKLNPKWTNTIIGLLINFAKILTVSITGGVGGTSLAVGVLVGLLVRTVVGHFLKKETWDVAFKQALIVTGLSLIGGAITKGIFSYFKGDGFMSGAKSYFIGTPDAGHAASMQQSEIDLNTLKLANVSTLTKELHNAFSTDHPPTSDELLKFFTDKGVDGNIAKNLAKSITGGDNASAAERFRDLWRMGGTSGDATIFNNIKALDTLTKNQYDKLLGGNVGDATGAIAGKVVQQAVKESDYKKVIKNLYL